MKFKRVVLQLLSGLAMAGLLACSPAPEEKTDEAALSENIMLLFSETEPDVDPYQTRILINKYFVRFDDGEASNDFILFDRKSGVIYSSSAVTRRILVIKPKGDTVISPIKIEITTTQNDDPDAPVIAGEKLKGWVMSANDKVCNEIMVVPGFLEEAAKALKEYHFQLAFEHADTLHNIPIDMQNACDIAMNVLASDWSLSKGFPVSEKHFTGYTRVLQDYNEDYSADPSLFELPKDYTHFSREDMGAF